MMMRNHFLQNTEEMSKVTDHMMRCDTNPSQASHSGRRKREKLNRIIPSGMPRGASAQWKETLSKAAMLKG
jgi:hypothetical protein